MLRTVKNRINNEFLSPTIYNTFTSSSFHAIKWNRKPKWMPTAKSKLFRVNERKRLPFEEAEELKRLHNNYRTAMKSIRHFLAEQNSKLSEDEGNVLLNNVDNIEEYNRCLQLNERWNEEVKKIREDTLAREKELELEEILKAIEESKQKSIERKAQIEEIVRLEKERSKTYITEQNIDEAIDAALENPIDYNFAIDVAGKYYHGRRCKPEKLKTYTETEEKETSVSAAAV